MPTNGHLKCAFCRKTYAYAGAFLNHHKREHAERVITVPGDMLPAAGYRLQGDFIELPDYENPVEVSARHDSDDDSDDDNEFSVSIVQDSHEESPEASITVYKNAGRPLGDALELDEDEIDPYRPFQSEQEYRIARWIVKNRISKTAVDDLFSIPGMKNVTSSSSAHTLLKRVDEMKYTIDDDSWKEGKVCFDQSVNPTSLRDSDMVSFWYRDPVECIEFLLQQPAYRDHMVYAPMHEHNEVGERMFSEINTGNWWWRIQVSPSSVTVVGKR